MNGGGEPQIRVELRGLVVFGRHGVHAGERELGQRFVVDVAIDLQGAEAAESDRLEDTVDYSSLADDVAAIVSGPSVSLLERLAGLIAERALEQPAARAVEVTVRKPHVALPHPVAETAVTLRRSRTGA